MFELADANGVAVGVTEGDRPQAGHDGNERTIDDLACELAIYLAASWHAKWHGFQTPVRVQGMRTVGRPNKSPITAR